MRRTDAAARPSGLKFEPHQEIEVCRWQAQKGETVRLEPKEACRGMTKEEIFPAIGSTAQAKKAEKCYGERFRSYWSWKANQKKDDPARDYRFYQFTTKSLKILDEKEFGAGPGGIFVRASIKRPKL